MLVPKATSLEITPTLNPKQVPKAKASSVSAAATSENLNSALAPSGIAIAEVRFSFSLPPSPSLSLSLSISLCSELATLETLPGLARGADLPLPPGG